MPWLESDYVPALWGELSPATARNQQHLVELVAAWAKNTLGRALRPRDLSPALAHRYSERLEEASRTGQISASTRRNRLKALKRLAAWLEARGDLPGGAQALEEIRLAGRDLTRPNARGPDPRLAELRNSFLADFVRDGVSPAGVQRLAAALRGSSATTGPRAEAPTLSSASRRRGSNAIETTSPRSTT